MVVSLFDNFLRLLRPSSCSLKKPNTRCLAFVAMVESKEKKPFERLPTHVVPKNYRLILEPNLEKFTFTGEEVIDLEVSFKHCFFW